MDDAKSWSKKKLAAFGRRVKRAPRIRHFPFLGGWAVVLVPLDVIESRIVARVYIGTMYGFEPDELIDLRARRLAVGRRRNVRTWWVMAVTPEAAARQRKPK